MRGVGRALVTVGIGSVMLSVATRLMFVTGSELETICTWAPMAR